MDLNLTDELDFSEIDLTPPDEVIKKILDELPKVSHKIIYGDIVPYSGPIVSYTEKRKSFLETSGTVATEKYIDIQNSLGKRGEEENRFECFLYTEGYNKYKFRMFFMQYGLAKYPVEFTLEESIARSIQTSASYFVSCKNREELEDLIFRILNSKKILGVMQELIRIYQARQNKPLIP